MGFLLHHSVTESAEREPEREAFRCDGEALSYGELEQRSNRVARWLLERGLERSDRVGLYLNTLGQGRHLNGSPGGIRLGKVLRHDGVHRCELTEIGQENAQFDGRLQRRACRFGHGGQIAEDLLGLGLKVLADHLHGRRVERNLARDIEGIAGLDGLRVRADGRRCLIG